ncbi:1426_t:CDS:10 [Diversispora eburnea]|uniref:1426_t:CDS:1 n=1 Tax=Diversispora eburnea TaxID=1213867 RepID=A0A9N8Z5X7_9GLOM|nr:1426_t:CDS:10 [Diversispora eburnea]
MSSVSYSYSIDVSESYAYSEARINNNPGVTLSWKDLCYTITDPKTNKSKNIVENVSGYVMPGEVMATGKSSFLDLLAGRKDPKFVSGETYLNGQPGQIKYVSTYVMQDDALMGVLTIRENIRFVESYVQNIIEEFGLERVADSKIGTVFVRGVSGGEKRRCAIASQVITLPNIIFLDEPTTGLDSAAAYNVMNAIKNMAQRHKLTVIASIHQPSTETYSLFDKLLILGSGKTLYFGERESALTYFDELGYACPSYANPADHFLNLVNSDFMKDRLEAEDHIQNFTQLYKGSTYKVETDSQITNLLEGTKNEEDKITSKNQSGYPRNFFSQTYIIMKRSTLNASRNILVFWIRVAMYVTLALLMGSTWWKVGLEQKNIQDRFSAHFFSVAFLVFMSVAGIPGFLEERLVFQRERANRFYSVGPYVLANTIVAIPFVLIIAISFSIVAYPMIALHPGFGHAVTFVLLLFLALFVAESMVVFVSSIIPIFVAALTIVAFANGFFMVVQGFFVRRDSITKIWKWAHYIDYQKYAFEGIIKNDFIGLTFRCANENGTCNCIYGNPTSPTCTFTGKDVLDSYGYTEIVIWKWAPTTGPIFPWSQIKLEKLNPFPRYGHSSNEWTNNNQIFFFGGIVGGKAQNDIFMLETTGEIPLARSNHSQVNIENNMIITKHWSKILIPITTSAGRYGHSANMIGNVMYIFGGQNERGIYFNDLITFDLKEPKTNDLGWKFVVPINEPPSVRAGHSVCSYQDNLYVFGGTDGIKCYNDLWCYDTKNNFWTEIICECATPIPRESHRASLIDDVFYIFGGRTIEGKELSDLAAFKLNSKQWFMFQKMGPSPSPRYWHTMTSLDKLILIFGGESSMQTTKPDEEGTIHVLDTTKIKYPAGTFPGTMFQQKRSHHSRSLSEPPLLSSSTPRTISSPKQLSSPKLNDKNYQNPFFSPPQSSTTPLHVYISKGNTVENLQQPSSSLSVNKSQNLLYRSKTFSDYPLHKYSDLIQSNSNLKSNNNSISKSPNVIPPKRILRVRPGGPKRILKNPILEVNTMIPFIDKGKSVDRNIIDINSKEKESKESNKESIPETTINQLSNQSIQNIINIENRNLENENNRKRQNQKLIHASNDKLINTEILQENFDGINDAIRDNIIIGTLINQDDIISETSSINRDDDIIEETLSINQDEIMTENSSINQDDDIITETSAAAFKRASLKTKFPQLTINTLNNFNQNSRIFSNNFITNPMDVYSSSNSDYIENYKGTVNTLSNLERENFLERLQDQDLLIAEMKKREIWFKAKLVLAKRAGYLLEFESDDGADIPEGIDLENLMDIGKTGSEKFKVIEAIVQLSQQLQQAKETIANQSKIASQKISDFERMYNEALKEAVNVGMMKHVMSEKRNRKSSLATRFKEIAKRCDELEALHEAAQIELKNSISRYRETIQKAKEIQENEELSEGEEFSDVGSSVSGYKSASITSSIELEQELRMVETNTTKTQLQLQQLKLKLNQVESDYQAAVKYAQSTENMLQKMKEELTQGKNDIDNLTQKLITVETHNIELEDKLYQLQKTLDTHDNTRNSILQEYASEQLFEQQSIFLKERGQLQQKIDDLQMKINIVQDEKNLMGQGYEAIRRVYESLRNQNETLKKSNKVLKQKTLLTEKMEEELEEELVRTLLINKHQSPMEPQQITRREQKKQNERQHDIGEFLEIQKWEEERKIIEEQINHYQYRNKRLVKNNGELEQKVIENECKVSILLDQMENVMDTYRIIEDKIKDLQQENSNNLLKFVSDKNNYLLENFEINRSKSITPNVDDDDESALSDPVYEGEIEDKINKAYPDLTNFVIPEYPNSPLSSTTENSEYITFGRLEEPDNLELDKIEEENSDDLYEENEEEFSNVNNEKEEEELEI